MEDSKKLYTPQAIAFATLLGGPIATGFLIRKNYIAMGDEVKALYSIILGIFATLLLLTPILLTPDSVPDNSLSSIIPLINGFVGYYLADWLQGKQIREHKELHGSVFTIARASGIGVLFSLGMFIVVLGFHSFSWNEKASKTLQQDFAQFQKNETEAIEIFNHLEAKDPQTILLEINIGLNKWQENLIIIQKIQNTEGISNDLQEQTTQLTKYCKLRTEELKIIQRSILQNNDKDLYKIHVIEKEIDKLLKSMH